MFEHHRLFSLKKWDTLGLRLDICDPGPPSNQMIASLRGSCLIQKIAASPAWKYHSMLNNLVVWNIRRCSTRPEFQIGRTSTTHWGNSSVYQHYRAHSSLISCCCSCYARCLCDSIGKAGEIDAETQALLFESGIDHALFTPEILNELPQPLWRVPSEEIAVRRDFRYWRFLVWKLV